MDTLLTFWGLALALIVGCGVGWRTWRQRTTRAWPRTQATFRTGKISLNDEAPREGAGWRIDFLFDYQVDGTWYAGEHSDGGTEGEVEQLLRSYQRGPLCVRYNPRDPSEYFFHPYDFDCPSAEQSAG